jgi:hypothetical protein
MRLRASRCQTDRAWSQDSWMPEKQNTPATMGSGRGNVTLHLLPYTACAETASGIQSIPAIQGGAGHGRSTLVPRTRSSHDFSASTVANFGFKSGTRIIELLVSFRFRSSLRGRCECLRTSESGH